MATASPIPIPPPRSAPDPEPVAGADPDRPLDLLLVNPPLRDYAQRPRTNDYTLPVLGMGYIATYAKTRGFNVGVLDAEARGLGISHTARIVNVAAPRWVGFNLLAPTYAVSARIAGDLAPGIQVMVGGHHAKAMPDQVLADRRFPRIDALVIGEGETRVAALLHNIAARRTLPNVWWRDPLLGTTACGVCPGDAAPWLGPDIDALPFVDRAFLPQDPYLAPDGRIEANIVGSRGCFYDCTFCGAAISMNQDVTIRTRSPESILNELESLHQEYGATAFRFVDDLFLGAARIIAPTMAAFAAARIGDRYVWDATGRINVLDHADDAMLDRLAACGLREVALGIESGSDRILKLMDKRITAAMTERVARRLLERGIGVKGYFILGYPGESADDLRDTLAHIRRLWDTADRIGRAPLRVSAFEFRPYPGTPVYRQLVADGHSPAALQAYGDVDLTDNGAEESMRGRDEFNFSVGIRFGGVPLTVLRNQLACIVREQHARNQVTAAAR